MRKIAPVFLFLIFYIFITLLFAVRATAQVKTDATQNKKFADALEAQISCNQKPEPTKVVRALQKAGIIARRPYNVVDSVSFFRVKKPLIVFGFKVYSVLGFDYTEIFARGPGTSPGTSLGIVVPYPVEEVKAKLKNLESKKGIIIDEAVDDIGIGDRSHIWTEIYCFSIP